MNPNPYTARRKKPEREGSLASLGDVLPGLYQDLRMDEKVNEFALLSLWPQLVSSVAGPAIAEQTKAVQIKRQAGRTTLVARVSTAAMASELGFHVTALQMALNGYAPQTGVTINRIHLTVGLLSEQGV